MRNTVRTKSTKQVEILTFEKLSTFSILMGAGKVIYGRHDTVIAFTLAGLGWFLAVASLFN